MKKDFQFPAMKRFQFPAIISNIVFICTLILLEADLNRPRSSSLSASLSASSPLPAAFIRILDAEESCFYALRRIPAAITPHFDCIRLKSTSRRTYCRSAFGYDAKGVC